MKLIITFTNCYFRIENDENFKHQIWQPRLVNMKDYLHLELQSEQLALMIVSTAGDGELKLAKNIIIMDNSGEYVQRTD